MDKPKSFQSCDFLLRKLSAMKCPSIIIQQNPKSQREPLRAKIESEVAWTQIQ